MPVNLEFQRGGRGVNEAHYRQPAGRGHMTADELSPSRVHQSVKEHKVRPQDEPKPDAPPSPDTSGRWVFYWHPSGFSV